MSSGSVLIVLAAVPVAAGAAVVFAPAANVVELNARQGVIDAAAENTYYATLCRQVGDPAFTESVQRRHAVEVTP